MFATMLARSIAAAALRVDLGPAAAQNRWMHFMWPPGYEDPVLHKKDLAEMKRESAAEKKPPGSAFSGGSPSGVSEEYYRKTINPVRAAPNYATCSLFRDPLVQKFHRLARKHSGVEKAEKEMLEVYRLLKTAQLRKKSSSAAAGTPIVADPVAIIKTAIENARPLMSLEKVKIGSVEYTVPAPITEAKSEFEGMRWILQAARDRDKSKSKFHTKLAEVLLETFAHTGRVVARKNDHHKTCDANRAYAHYRRSK